MPIASHLILDPNLSPEQRAYLRSRATSLGIKCVEIDGMVGAEAIMRAKARELGLNCIVVLADPSSAARHFSDAPIRITGVRVAATGCWVLTDFPEALPAPPLLPAKLWDDSGRPLIPDLEMHSSFDKSGSVDPGVGQFTEVRSYPLGDWLRFRHLELGWLGEVDGVPPRHALPEHAVPDAGKALLAVASGAQPTKSFLWSNKRRLFALGNHAGFAQLRQHHSVEPSEAISILETAIRTLNLWSSPHWPEVQAQVRSSCGLPLLSAGSALAESCGLRLMLPSQITAEKSTLDAARAILQDIATRELDSVSPEYALTFQSIADAPIRCGVTSSPSTHAIHVNLGAGRMVTLLAFVFTGEKRRPLKDGDNYNDSHSRGWLCFDGGDLRFYWKADYSILLEGTSLVPRRRRRQSD